MFKKLSTLRYISWCLMLAIFTYILISGILHPVVSSAVGRGLAKIYYKDILWNNFYAVVLGIILFFISLLMLVITTTMKNALTYSMRKTIALLSQFVFCAFVWTVSDSKILTFLTNNADLKSLLTYIAFTSMFAFLFEFVMSIFGEMKPLKIATYILYAMEVFLLFKYFIYFEDKKNYITCIHIIVLITSLFILWKLIMNMKDDQTLFAKYLFIGYLIMMCSGALSMYFYYDNIKKVEYSLVFTFGIAVFCLFLSFTSLKRVGESILKEANEEAYRKLAYTDEMTNINNKTAYVEYERSTMPSDLIIVVCDLNHLKRINDMHGHKAGDDAIIQAANYLVRYFPRENCYRFGGDEFIITLTGTTLDEVAKTVKLVKDQMTFDNKNKEIPVEFAFGYDQAQPNDTIRSLFLRADKYMYQDKMKSGHGRE